VVELELVWGGRGATELRDRLREVPSRAARLDVLEAALRARLCKPRALHSAVRQGLQQFHGAPHIDSVMRVARDAGLSRRRFAQVFREQVGVTPKLYCRIRRFQQVVRQIGLGVPVDWAAVALAAGYYDQAHLANDFRDFAGITPSAYAATERVFLNHVPID
jgi:AraC-like DNA-binding protein